MENKEIALNDLILEEEQDDTVLEEEQVIPARNSPEWNDFIMGQFLEDEMFEGNPTTDGLRRLAEKYVGEIVDSRPRTVVASVGYAAVEYTIVFRDVPGHEKTFASVADVHQGNTDNPYYNYAVAVAETRAEGRALRKALGLRKIVTAEEVSQVAYVSSADDADKPINSAQISAIDRICSKVDIDVMAFVNSGKGKYSDIKGISRDTAAKIIQQLNKYQHSSEHPDYKEVTPEIKGYKENWKGE